MRAASTGTTQFSNEASPPRHFGLIKGVKRLTLTMNSSGITAWNHSVESQRGVTPG